MEAEKEEYWLPCPCCKRRTKVKVLSDTTLIHFPLYCQWCKQETIINIVARKMYLDKTYAK